MTLSQLRTFALVARLGSLRAAAAELGVSEPAVSAALAALRRDLDDPLFVRAGGGIAFTAGGRRLAAHADEIVGLADQARREVQQAASSGAGTLRVAATAAFAEHAAPALLDAFTRRVPNAAVDLVVRSAAQLAECLVDRSVDITLGSRPPAAGDSALNAVPFLRYGRLLVCAPDHPAAHLGEEVRIESLAAQAWLSGPAGIEAGSQEAHWLARHGVRPDTVRLGSETDALAAARAGEGVHLALAHVVREDLRAGRLVRLPVAGTPVAGLWFATAAQNGRILPEARTLQAFVTTPDATAAMVTPGGASRADRRRPAVRVTLWS